MAVAPRLRVQSIFALKSHRKQVAGWFFRLVPKPKRLRLGPISDHIARDIGLSDAEIERHRPRLPSQAEHYPRG